MTPTPYYFGCRDESGHFVWTPDGQRVRKYGASADIVHFLYHTDNLLTPTAAQQGQASFGRLFGYSFVSFKDYSVDSRPGSNSVFAIPGDWNYGETMERAKTVFPWVWERFGFEVVPYVGAEL